MFWEENMNFWRENLTEYDVESYSTKLIRAAKSVVLPLG